MISRRNIEDIHLKQDFHQHSEDLGYTADIVQDYADDIAQLITLWREQCYVEIYSEDNERQWGRIKSMSADTLSPGAIPYYLNLFHSRVTPTDNDPLLVVTIEDKKLVIHFMADHDDLFGSFQEKNNNSLLKRIKKKISDMVFK